MKTKLYKLYCIKEIIDPRFTDVKFNIGETVGLYNNSNGAVSEINDIEISICFPRDEILCNKKYFLEVLRNLTNFKFEDYFVPLAIFRDKQIDDILNDGTS